MDKRIIKGLIDEKLEVIQEQFSIIREYEAKIPIIELDLLMTSIRDLYELVLNLQLENMGGAKPQPGEKKEIVESAPITESPVATAPEKEEVKESEEESPVRFSSSILSMERVIDQDPPEEDVVQSVMPDPEPPVTEETESSPPDPEPYHQEQVVPEPMPVAIEQAADEQESKNMESVDDQPHEKPQRLTADLFSEGAGNTLADRLKEGQEKRIADKLQENIGVDLRTTIGINDKFLFINELFGGNMKDYDEAVQKLNTSATMAQTDLLLLDLKIDHKWDSESPTVKKFVELVRRKF